MRVNVDAKAYTDGRFHALGLALGAPEQFAHDVGLAKMSRIWAYCTEHARHSLLDWEIDAVIGKGGALKLESYRLAEACPDGWYIKGTKGRIEWLAKKRLGAKKSREKVATNTNSPDVLADIKADVPRDIQEQGARSKEVSPPLSLSGSGSGSDAREAPTLELTPVVPAWDRESDLDEAYLAYPRRIGKTAGMKRLRAGEMSIRSRADGELLKLAVRHYAEYTRGQEERFIKHWSTFTGEWRDWVAPRAPPVMRAGSVLSVDELIAMSRGGA